MTLSSEIDALRAQVEAVSHRPAPVAEPRASVLEERSPAPDQAVETFLQALNDTLDDFAGELEKHPRLTALATLGVGLAAGVIIGRQTRQTPRD